MKKYIKDPEGNLMKRVPNKGWVRFPDGTHVCEPESGFSTPKGYTVVEVEETQPPNPSPEETIRTTAYDAVSILTVLYERGWLEQVKAAAKVAGGKTEIFFDRSPNWYREGEHEKFLMGQIREKGKPLTETEIDSVWLEVAT